jgi:hypothetical protein
VNRGKFIAALLTLCALIPSRGAEVSAPALKTEALHAESHLLAAAPIYSRTTNWFSETVLFKPAETEPAPPFFSFAPLILQWVGGREQVTTNSHDFGRLYLSNNLVCVEPAQPTLYASVDTVELTPGSSHPRFTYLWCYPGEAHARLAWPELQGLRVVLNAQGHPVIWQILADSTGTQLFFVSQSLETAAAASHGKVLQGRRYAIERSIAEVPNVVVARVLEDGPVPMGPIVYLQANRDVSTVICRCMPAQARRVAEARTYELLPFAEHESMLAAVREQAKLKPSFWPGASDPSPKVGDLLRLP